MKRTIEWLITIEHMAHIFYAQAAERFSEPALRGFLEHAAKDELRHREIMDSALNAVRLHPPLLPAVSMDEKAKRRLENSFKKNQQKLNSGALTTESLIDCIVETELSEWNHVFTYVVNALKQIEPEFKGAAAGIQHHLAQIRHFLDAQPYAKAKIDALHALHPVWKENILIVDDSEAVLDLLSTVLDDEGHVVTAENGKIGLEKIQRSYYQLIISDVEMPVMNGLELYLKASAEFPGIQDRFVFFTGDPSPLALDFFRKHQLNYLTKPATIQQIKSIYLQSMRKLSKAG